MNFMLVTLFVVAFLAGGALLFYVIRLSARRRAEIEQMAAGNGWRHQFIPASGGSGSSTIIDNEAEGWMLEIFVQSSTNSNNSGSSTRWSMFTHSRAGIDQGMAVLGPEIPAKTAAMADKFLGMMGGDIGRWMLDKITGGLGNEAAGLRSVDGDGSGHLMASPGAETALDQIRETPDLLAARLGKSDNHQPIVMRGPFGMRLRVSRMLKTAAEVEDFIKLGLQISQTLTENPKQIG